MADSNTVVGESILIKGNLEGDEDLTVQGHIEGSINLNKTLIIEPSGVVKAEVSVSNAIISGIMVGNLSASDSVELTESGRMVGDIQAPRIIITEGASFKGRVDMGDPEMPRPAGQTTGATYRPARPVVSKPTPPRPAPVKPAPPKPEPVKELPRPAPRKPMGKESKKKKVGVKKKR